MTLMQVWGAFLIFLLCPLLGGIPLTGWIVRGLTGQRLSQLGTGNIGVSAAFYHGGTGVGILAVGAEAFKGIAAVLLAQYFFPTEPVWAVIALIALVMGRYWMGRSAGVTNVVWGFLVYDPIVAGLTFLISFIGFTILRERQQGRLFVLILLPLLTALRHNDGGQVLAVAGLSGLIAWIYQKLPDDLELPVQGARVESQRFFQFFRGEGALKSLDQVWSSAQVGAKAATLSQLKAWGYPVPRGYVLQAGDDPAALVKLTQPSAAEPVVVRSSAIGEDSLTASAAGQYQSVVNVTSQTELEAAIATCFNAYNAPSATRYRQDRGLPDAGMNLLVQQQVQGLYSGVAFSRDPITRWGNTVVIEALPGAASPVVSGQITPERYRVPITDTDLQPGDPWQLPEALELSVDGRGQVPCRLLQQVAFLTRHLEQTFHGIPQDVEWSFDGEQLWVLQSRPITTLMPIWTRKIAAEVIPGVIRPLTWSINRPLTCGVWGDIFSLVLGKRAADLDFEATATLYHSHAYFNATLLGEIFTRMGLPAKSLEFLTRGARFERPPLLTTLRNLPGLARLTRQEWTLPQDYSRDHQHSFQPGLAHLQATDPAMLAPPDLAKHIDTILDLLRRVTWYNILAPLSLALRQALLKVDNPWLDQQSNPEIRAIRDLKALALQLRPLLGRLETLPDSGSSLFAAVAEHPEGQQLFDALEAFLAEYGYLSEVATDIAVPTWRENSQPVRALLADFMFYPPTVREAKSSPSKDSSAPPSAPPARWKIQQIQARLDLKGQVNELYNRLLAALRACFVAQETHWLAEGTLMAKGDIFFLTWPEIKAQLTDASPLPWSVLQATLQARKQAWTTDAQPQPIPYLVYGNDPPRELHLAPSPLSARAASIMQGIGASPGQVEGEVCILTSLDGMPQVGHHTILVVPYTDAGWAPLLARTGGLIAEVGGQLSHGAIVAREYGIPAVMDVADATHRLVNGQRVRIDGQRGTIEIL
jgi:phosphohistidine swiveling domain-containing protein/glycerol-3-phosphate acyltransferase PlsY